MTHHILHINSALPHAKTTTVGGIAITTCRPGHALTGYPIDQIIIAANDVECMNTDWWLLVSCCRMRPGATITIT